ncbi:MAG TPA: hypothetical protein ENN17_03110 [bacterium]|nr:hypothetical protein [bacterium]
MTRKRGGSAGLFFGGFAAGLMTAVLVLIIAGMSVLNNPRKMAGLAKRFGMVKVVEKTVVRTVTRTVHSLPRDVVAIRQDRINRTFRNLTEAYSENRMTFEDIEKLADRIFLAMADQSMTPKELDDLLTFAETLGR